MLVSIRGFVQSNSTDCLMTHLLISDNRCVELSPTSQHREPDPNTTTIQWPKAFPQTLVVVTQQGRSSRCAASCAASLYGHNGRMAPISH